MQQPKIEVQHIDLPDLRETFADSVPRWVFDGQTLRIEFAVTRLQEPTPPKPPTAKQYPACRLVLTPAAAIDLINKMQGIAGALEQAGILKREPPQAERKLNS